MVGYWVGRTAGYWDGRSVGYCCGINLITTSASEVISLAALRRNDRILEKTQEI